MSSLDLLCAEGEFPRRAFADPVFIKDDRVLENLLDMEKHYLIVAGHMEQQEDVKPYMRKVVVQWMLEVCDEQQCEEEVFTLAVNFFDRFLSITTDVPRRHLQLLATACLFIASKLKESYPLSAEKLVIYTDYSITLSQLLDWELLVLSKLKFDVSSIVALDFLDVILDRLRLSPETTARLRKHSLLFIMLLPLDVKSVAYPPSMVASACICAGVETMTSSYWRGQTFIDHVRNIINCDRDCLKACQEYVIAELKREDNSTSTKSAQCSSNPGTPTALLDIDVN